MDIKPSFKAPTKSLARDGLLTGSSLAGSCALLLASGVAVYSNLMNSGNMVFIQNPWIPAALSVLPAVGAFSFKLMANVMPERYQEPYRITINALSIFSILCWIVCFGVEFHNNGGGEIDLTMTEAPSSHFAVALTISQLLAEILCAATLFLAADAIAQKYISDQKIENPDYQALQKEYQQESKIYAELLAKRNEKEGRLKKLQMLKDIYIKEQIASFFNISAQLKP